MSLNDIAKELTQTIKKSDDKKTSAYDTSATVTRVENGIAWVHIPGGVEETPVKLTVNAEAGDEVQIRVGGGSAWIVGNASAPPTDDALATIAQGTAVVAQKTADAANILALNAKNAADVAWHYADEAKTAADNAENSASAAQVSASAAQASASSALESATNALASATAANTSANSALTQLGIVEDVVDVLRWISEHGTYKISTDTEVVPGKYYFVISDNTYNVVPNPTGNPSTNGYYELDNVDEAVSNYVSSHLALTNQGLLVVKDDNGYKLLAANDGVKVYDPTGSLVATYGESISFSSSRSQKIGGDNAFIEYYDSNEDGNPDSLRIVGANLSFSNIGIDQINMPDIYEIADVEIRYEEFEDNEFTEGVTYYTYNSSTDTYVITTDTSPIEGKIYYYKVPFDVYKEYFEYDDQSEEYVPTSDVAPVEGKNYYQYAKIKSRLDAIPKSISELDDDVGLATAESVISLANGLTSTEEQLNTLSEVVTGDIQNNLLQVSNTVTNQILPQLSTAEQTLQNLSNYAGVFNYLAVDQSGLNIYGIANKAEQPTKVSVQITGDRINLNQAGNPMAYLGREDDSANSTYALYIDKATVVQAVQIGTMAFIPRSNGNMCLKFIGQ